MFCERCYELIKEIDRAQDTMPPFNGDAVRSVIDEILQLYSDNVTYANESQRDFEEGSPEEKAHLTVIAIRHLAIERNKRCLMAYAYNRMQLIRQMRWQFGSILPPEIKINLCEHEIQWFNGYSKILASYMRSIGGEMGLNLSQDVKPPKCLNVQVRCLMDYGKFELDNGEVVLLKKNSIHLMSRAQCEPLIVQGILEHVKH